MSPVSTKPSESALPPEFSHKALQSLVRKGSTTGSVTGQEVAEALRAADVRAARGRVVLRALGEQGITVTMDPSATGVAAATSTTKKTAARATATKPAAKTTAAKTTAAKSTATKTARRGEQGRRHQGCPGDQGCRDQGCRDQGCPGARQESGRHDDQGRCHQGDDDAQGRRGRCRRGRRTGHAHEDGGTQDRHQDREDRRRR